MQIIGLNGPPRSGKTTLADKLIAKITNAGKSVTRLGYADVLYKPAMELMRFKPYLSHLWEGSVELFKDHEFTGSDGKTWTGRDVIIELSENMQKRDSMYLIHALEAKLATALDHRVDIVIVENVGKLIEWERLMAWPSAQLNGGVISKPMLFGLTERREPSINNPSITLGRIYGHGERFPGDNRVSLHHDYKIINPTPTQVLSLAGIEA